VSAGEWGFAPGASAEEIAGGQEGGGSAVQPRGLEIWIVSQSYLPHYGGITEHAWHLAARLAARGHRVHLLTGNPDRAGRAPRDADPPGVEVVRWGRTLRVPSHGARACVTLAWPAGPTLKRLRRAQVVHLQSPLEPFLPLWALHHARGVKIGTFHTGGSRDHWGYRYFSGWLRGSALGLDRRLAVSAEAARFAAAHFPGEYLVVPNGVDLTRFAPPAGAAADGARPATEPAAGARILQVGRLDPRKGLAHLLEACGALRHACPPAGGIEPQLTLVGDGPERRWLWRQAAREGLRVRFAGAVARGELARFYAEADIFAAPATDGESFGVALLEAMAAGLPIVAADLPGYRETLAGSGAALLYPADSPAQLAQALACLAADAPRRRELGLAGSRFVRRYDWGTIARRVEEVYLEALDHHAARAGGPGPAL
jgi:phosphatidylinositol alpha-mannosyltransferase